MSDDQDDFVYWLITRYWFGFGLMLASLLAVLFAELLGTWENAVYAFLSAIAWGILGGCAIVARSHKP